MERDRIKEVLETFQRETGVAIRFDVFGSEYSTGRAALDDLVDRIAELTKETNNGLADLR